VWPKLLFGTDYPFTTVDASVAGLRVLNGMLEGTKLPRLETAAIEAMIQARQPGAAGTGGASPASERGKKGFA